MTREEAKQEAKTRLREYYSEQVDKRGVCPICGGGHKTACFSIDHKTGWTRWSCYSCKRHGDIFDLYAAINGVSSGEAMEGIFAKYGLSSYRQNESKMEHNAAAKAAQAAAMAEARAAAREIRARWGDTMQGTDGEAYLRGRGLDALRAQKIGVFYDGERRLVCFPTNTGGFVGRAIDAGAKNRYYNSKGTGAGLFNLDVLGEAGADSAPVFIVEGAIDALSMMEAGAAAAVGLNSVDNARLLVDYCRERAAAMESAGEGWRPKIILALDNDEAGRTAAGKLYGDLEAMGFQVVEAESARLFCGAKDANEALIKERENFMEQVKAAAAGMDAAMAEARAAYQAENSAAAFREAFWEYVHTPRPSIPTGFPRFDMTLSGDGKNDAGGLYEGLYIIGAPSSCGKTTFTLQMCDTIAASGRDILFFTLEMSKNELISRSLSRLTYELEKARPKVPSRGVFAKTSLGILKGARYAHYDTMDKEIIRNASERYFTTIAPHIFFVEGAITGTSVEAITARIEEHIRRSGNTPVVVVDYLQMVDAPEEMLGASDKQKVDYVIRALKVASRNTHTPLIVISSLNRSNYEAEASLAAFKESGAIEYTADIVLALTYANAAKAEQGDKNKGAAKLEQKVEGMKPDRELDLEILKNRNGQKGRFLLHYEARWNHFAEYPLEEEEELRDKWAREAAARKGAWKA